MSLLNRKGIGWTTSTALSPMTLISWRRCGLAANIVNRCVPSRQNGHPNARLIVRLGRPSAQPNPQPNAPSNELQSAKGSGRMFVLDTDHLTLLEWGSGAIGQRLHERVGALPEGEVVWRDGFEDSGDCAGSQRYGPHPESQRLQPCDGIAPGSLAGGTGNWMGQFHALQTRAG